MEKLKTELQRKSIHLATSVIPLVYYFYPHQKLFLFLLGALFIFALLVEFLRINVTKIKHKYENLLGKLLRPGEKGRSLNGATYLLLGFWLSVWLFPVEISVVAMLLLTVSDTLAALVGMAVGRHPVFGKTWEGFLTFFISAWLLSWLITNNLPAAGIMAFVTGVVEMLPLKVNDNLLIPLTGGTLLMILL